MSGEVNRFVPGQGGGLIFYDLIRFQLSGVSCQVSGVRCQGTAPI